MLAALITGREAVELVEFPDPEPAPSGVVVDTHVGRISQRLGLTSESNPEKIERELMDLLPKKEWIDFSHRVIHHGRQICKARKPACDKCSGANRTQKRDRTLPVSLAAYGP